VERLQTFNLFQNSVGWRADHHQHEADWYRAVPGDGLQAGDVVTYQLNPNYYHQSLVVNDVADVGLVARNNVSAASKRLTGYEPTPWATEVWDIQNWRTA
jgi:hypothetical protein